MSARRTAYKIIRIPVDGGESPNAYIPQITVEIRAAWPPNLGHETTVGNALTEAYTEALNEIVAQRSRRG